MSDEFNMSMRKFLKHVGVTSQQQIEAAMRNNGEAGKSYTLKMTLTCDELGLDHSVTGDVSGE